MLDATSKKILKESLNFRPSKLLKPKLILLKNYRPSDECWAYLLRMKKVLELTVEQVLDKYQGFEGKRIAMHSLKGGDPDLKGMIDLFRETAAVGRYAMLCVDQGDGAREVLKGVVRMGFDVGVCEEERNVYSSIFNEVLFGYYEELIGFQELLNENFLFSSRDVAEGYVEVHDRMAAEGKGVEEGVEMNIYEVWKYV